MRYRLCPVFRHRRFDRLLGLLESGRAGLSALQYRTREPRINYASHWPLPLLAESDLSVECEVPCADHYRQREEAEKEPPPPVASGGIAGAPSSRHFQLGRMVEVKEPAREWTLRMSTLERWCRKREAAAGIAINGSQLRPSKGPQVAALRGVVGD